MAGPVAPIDRPAVAAVPTMIATVTRSDLGLICTEAGLPLAPNTSTTAASLQGGNARFRTYRKLLNVME
jgi:hypothetical protein